MEDETRSFMEVAKGELFDSLLNQIDDKFHATIFAPPKGLLPFLEGKELETEEARDCRRLYERWTDGVLRALERKPKTAETLQELLAALPESFRENLIRAFRESIVKS